MHFRAPSLLLLVAGAVAAPFPETENLLTERANSDFSVVPHSSIRFIPESYRGGAEGNAIRRYEPYLHIAHGCQSYPAVSSTGQVGGGLQNSGGPSDGCNDPTNGQTYVRGAWYKGRYAIMYAWYFPKDQITAGLNGGHRHDWESVVIWIDNRTCNLFTSSSSKPLLIQLSLAANANPHVFGGAASGHGGYKKTALPQMRDGNRLQVEYFTSFPTNHELQFKVSPGVDHAMIDYNTVNAAVRRVFDGYDWGMANCPFSSVNFEENLGNAWV